MESECEIRELDERWKWHLILTTIDVWVWGHQKEQRMCRESALKQQLINLAIGMMIFIFRKLIVDEDWNKIDNYRFFVLAGQTEKKKKKFSSFSAFFEDINVK